MSLYLNRIHQSRQDHLSALDSVSFPKSVVEIIKRCGAPVGCRIEHYANLDRCMGRLQQLIAVAEEGGTSLAGGTVVIADALNCSVGRFERSWHAPSGGVWMALAWPDIFLPEFTRLLPFAAGLACCRTVQGYGVDASLKWVNDLQVRGKKLAGILCNTVLSPAGERYHLLGLGMNVNNRDFPAALVGSSTSLSKHFGRTVDLPKCIGRLLAELSWALGLLQYDEEQSLQEQRGCADGRIAQLLLDWQKECDSLGRRVEYGFDVQSKPMYRGVVTGFDPCGGLTMRLADDSIITEYSGEIRYL